MTAHYMTPNTVHDKATESVLTVRQVCRIYRLIVRESVRIEKHQHAYWEYQWVLWHWRKARKRNAWGSSDTSDIARMCGSRVSILHCTRIQLYMLYCFARPGEMCSSVVDWRWHDMNAKQSRAVSLPPAHLLDCLMHQQIYWARCASSGHREVTHNCNQCTNPLSLAHPELFWQVTQSTALKESMKAHTTYNI